MALSFAALYRHRTGHRSDAEQFAREAVDVLGPDSDDQDVARALEIGGYLAMMDYGVSATLRLVEQTPEVAGSGIDDRILVRSLNHRGVAMNFLNYPEGMASLDEARLRAEAAGIRNEMFRAIVNASDSAVESRDLATAMNYVRMARALPVLSDEAPDNPYTVAVHATVLALRGVEHGRRSGER